MSDSACRVKRAESTNDNADTVLNGASLSSRAAATSRKGPVSASWIYPSTRLVLAHAPFDASLHTAQRDCTARLFKRGHPRPPSLLAVGYLHDVPGGSRLPLNPPALGNRSGARELVSKALECYKVRRSICGRRTELTSRTEERKCRFAVIQ